MMASVVAPSDSVRLGSQVIFADGIYASGESLVTSQPEFKGERGVAVYTATAGESLLVDPDLRFEESRFVVQDGALYVLDDPCERMTSAMKLPKVRVSGLWSHYITRCKKEVSIPMAVYDPITGDSLYAKSVTRSSYEDRAQIINILTGETMPLTPLSLRIICKDDKQLTATLADLDDNAIQSKLLKILYIYNDRHPVWLSVDKDE